MQKYFSSATSHGSMFSLGRFGELLLKIIILNLYSLVYYRWISEIKSEPGLKVLPV